MFLAEDVPKHMLAFHAALRDEVTRPAQSWQFWSYPSMANLNVLSVEIPHHWNSGHSIGDGYILDLNDTKHVLHWRVTMENCRMKEIVSEIYDLIDQESDTDRETSPRELFDMIADEVKRRWIDEEAIEINTTGDEWYIRIGSLVYPEEYVHFELDDEECSIKLECKLFNHPDRGVVVSNENAYELWEALDDILDFVPFK